MPMGMPYPKGDMAMQKGKMSMSEMMGVEKKPSMMEPKMKAKAKGKKMPPFTKKK